MTSNALRTMNSIDSNDMYVYQQRSPFFRMLPRELRNNIYEAYLLEQNGYYYRLPEGKLTLGGRKPISLDLIYTCKAVATEMHGLALRTNRVTFTTSAVGFQENIDPGGKTLTRAVRLRRLLNYAAIFKHKVLLEAATCIRPDIMEKIIQRYPTAGMYIQEAVEEVLDVGVDIDPYEIDGAIEDWLHTICEENPPTTRDALQLAYDLTSVQPDFRRLAQNVLNRRTSRGTLKDVLSWDSCSTLLDWRPKPWYMPSEGELVKLEKHAIWDFRLVQFDDEYPLEDTAPVKLTFSAAATAINFLRRFPNQRKHLRNIIIHEDLKSISRPTIHSKGLAFYYTENPMLRIQRHVGLYSNILPLDLEPIHRASANYHRRYLGFYPGTRISEMLRALLEWFEEDDSVAMPTKHYCLRFDPGPRDENVIHAWEQIKEATMVYECILECTRRMGLDEANLAGGGEQQDESRTVLSLDFTRSYDHSPQWISENFIRPIKGLVLGENKNVSFVGSSRLAPVWDTAAIARELENGTWDTWRKAWDEMVYRMVPFPPGGFKAILKKYMFDNHPVHEKVKASSKNQRRRRR